MKDNDKDISADLISLDEFIKNTNPGNPNQFLTTYIDDIITLYSFSYTIKQIYEYLVINGYTFSYVYLCRWIKSNIDLTTINIKSTITEYILNQSKNNKEFKKLESNLTSTDSSLNESKENDLETTKKRMAKSLEKFMSEESIDEQFASLKNK